MTTNDAPRATPPDSLRDLAEAAARRGGDVVREGFSRPIAVQRKADGSEVTATDIAAQRAVVDFVQQHRPDDVVLGEESTERLPPDLPPDTCCWIVDPLDGTRNFTRGIPIFACSVAVLRRGQPLAGAIYDPIRDTMFSAATGRGATAGGDPLNVAAARDPRWKPVVAIPSGIDTADSTLVHYLVEHYNLRNVGSAALHLAYVAAGCVDAAVLANCKLWDVAAGALLVTEAGGRITRHDGTPLLPLDPWAYDGRDLPCIAGAPDLHAHLLTVGRG